MRSHVQKEKFLPCLLAAFVLPLSIGCSAEGTQSADEELNDTAFPKATDGCLQDANCRAGTPGERRLMTKAADGKNLCLVTETLFGNDIIKFSECNPDGYGANLAEIWSYSESYNQIALQTKSGRYLALWAVTEPEERVQLTEEERRYDFVVAPEGQGEGYLTMSSGPSASFCATIEMSPQGHATLGITSTSRGKYEPRDYTGCAAFALQRPVQVFGVRDEGK